AGDRLAVDNAGAGVQACQRVDDQREATGKFISRTAVEPHLRALLARDDAEAVVLDLVQPQAAGRQLVGFGWETRRDEPGRDGTLQHDALSKLAKGNCNLDEPAFFGRMVLVMAGRPPAGVASPGPSGNPHGGAGRFNPRLGESVRAPANAAATYYPRGGPFIAPAASVLDTIWTQNRRPGSTCQKSASFIE